MSHRYVQAVFVAVLLAFTSMPVRPAHAQQQVPSAPPTAAAPAAAPAGTGMNLIGVPAPVKGKLYRFSLCTGEILEASAVSRPCYPAEAKGVSGAAPNHPIAFHLENTSFLPPGFTLDGNGVITGAADADLSKLKAVNICAIQQGAINTNYLCKGQSVNFTGLKVKTPEPAPVATPGGGGGGMGTAVKVGLGIGGAAAAGIFAAKALEDLKTTDFDGTGASTTTTTTTPSTGNFIYANWNCNGSAQCAAVFGHSTGSVGPFCSVAPCNDWHVHQGGGTSCTSAPQFVVYSSPRSGCSTTWNGF